MFKWLLPVVALCWIPARASTIFYSDSGTFSALTPSSAFSAPSETWAFAFQIDSNPAVSDVSLGNVFVAAFSDFSYMLNGSPVAITPIRILFFNTVDGGGLGICFSGTPCANGFGITNSSSGPQMYTGLESAPTMLSGEFNLNTGVSVSSTIYSQANTTVQATVVPEPSTLLPIAAGLLALGGRRLYWRGTARRVCGRGIGEET